MTAPGSRGSSPDGGGRRPHLRTAAPVYPASSAATLTLAALLMLACTGLVSWLLWSSEVRRSSEVQASAAAAEPTAVLTNQVRGLEVATRPDRLSVTFSTDRDAECRLEFGYTQQDLRFRSNREGWSSRQHLLAVEGLKPGAGWFRIRGRLKDGSSFCEPVAEVVIPEASPAEAPATAPTASLAATTTASPAAGGATGGAAGAGALARRTADGSRGGSTSQPEAEAATAAAVVLPTVAATAPYAQLPPADPNDQFGKRALAASSCRVAFGPASLAPDVRAKLEARIRELYREWDKRGDLNVARELARTYVEFRDLRKAYFFSDLLLAARPKDEECLRIHLDYFRKYGMGWKVQETWARLLEVRPDDRDLRAEAARDQAVFGQHRTLGPADKGVLQ